MTNIQNKINDIIAARKSKLHKLERLTNKWQELSLEISNAVDAIEKAEQLNPDVAGSTAKIRGLLSNIRSFQEKADKVNARFSRNTICIGIGGAARMGKSTLLQSITGLGEDQLPTSDKYFTTATRSQIEHCLNDNVALADFHTEESFLAYVIAPLCRNIKLQVPRTFDEFVHTKFELPKEYPVSQEANDILDRLRDAQTYQKDYREYLTGEHKRRIALKELRPFVAYPVKDGVTIKAGPYLAIANLVIRTTFPAADIESLRVVDLPGLGEAGIDLAKAQTEGMADICDITFLVKRPTDTKIEWDQTDSNALDAMGAAVPLLDDQTKYTAILANVGNLDNDRAAACVRAIKNKLNSRPFEIIECNARDREAISTFTMPQILDFMARSLPYVDDNLITRMTNESNDTLRKVCAEISEMAKQFRKLLPEGKSIIRQGDAIHNGIAKALNQLEDETKALASGADLDWEHEIENRKKDVNAWISEGCGYNSKEEFLTAIADEIGRRKGNPSQVTNECRVKFRTRWEVMDTHLKERIAKLLVQIIEAIQTLLHGVVPAREQTGNNLQDVRRQLLGLAERIDARHSDEGDQEALRDLSAPLRRIAEFDLQFRFHLEPSLRAATHLLLTGELPNVNERDQANIYADALCEKLFKASEDYATEMLQTASNANKKLERQKRLLEKAITDEQTRKDVLNMLEQACSASMSFCPNRVFAALVETFTDAFIRSKNASMAFEILVREWRDELTPAPDEKTRLLSAASGMLGELNKELTNELNKY